MKLDSRNGRLTLGELIAAVCQARGRRRAVGVLRLAIKARVVVFRKPQPLLMN